MLKSSIILHNCMVFYSVVEGCYIVAETSVSLFLTVKIRCIVLLITKDCLYAMHCQSVPVCVTVGLWGIKDRQFLDWENRETHCVRS